MSFQQFFFEVGQEEGKKQLFIAPAGLTCLNVAGKLP
jgi:hypothetical protein